ncbi:hypothetical protein K8R14_05495 [bacterium]|nr:hypothetical protein [bacterium]
MIKVKTTGQILPFKSGTALPSPSQAHGYKEVVRMENDLKTTDYTDDLWWFYMPIGLLIWLIFFL